MTTDRDDRGFDALELRRSMYDAVAHGNATIVGDRDGDPVFALTDAGKRLALSFVDAAIAGHGHNGAAAAIAEALDVPRRIADDLVRFRLEELAADARAREARPFA